MKHLLAQSGLMPEALGELLDPPGTGMDRDASLASGMLKPDPKGSL